MDDRREGELEREARKYRAIFENAVEGIFQSTPDGRIVEVNPALARMLGYESPADMVENLRDIAAQHYADPAQREELKDRLARDGVVEHFEFEGKRRDGERIWLSENVRTVRGADGGVLYYEGTIEDVTLRKRHERELARLHAFYEQVLQNLPASVAVFDPAGRVLYLNAAAELDPDRRRRMIGRTEADYAREVSMPASALEVRREAFERCVREKRAVTLEEEVSVFGREPQWFVRFHSPVLDARGEVRMVIRYGIEVTERRHLEEHLRQSQKMEAVGRLAGGVAHDFNNLLTVVTGYSDLILSRLPGGNPAARHASEIRKAADRATALTGQLLAFSRKQVLDLRVRELDAFLGDTLTMLRRLVGEHIEVLFRPSGGTTRVRADLGQLTQVLINLAANARDAMPRGGRIAIETGRESVERRSFRPGAPQPGEYVRLVVADEGEGFSPEALEHLFEPFFTTKGRGRGVGLGLPTVYGIVRQSGGTISVECPPGGGTRFRILLPAVDEEPTDPDAGTDSPPARHGSETILVAEDETPIRAIVRDALESHGYRVLTAAHGAEALEVARGHEGGIDLLVSDVVMPRMGGGELAQSLLRDRPGTRVLFMSGYNDDTLVHHGVSQEDQAFLQKPFTPEQFLEKVRRVLDA